MMYSMGKYSIKTQEGFRLCTTDIFKLGQRQKVVVYLMYWTIHLCLFFDLIFWGRGSLIMTHSNCAVQTWVRIPMGKLHTDVPYTSTETQQVRLSQHHPHPKLHQAYKTSKTDKNEYPPSMGNSTL